MCHVAAFYFFAVLCEWTCSMYVNHTTSVIPHNTDLLLANLWEIGQNIHIAHTSVHQDFHLHQSSVCVARKSVRYHAGKYDQCLCLRPQCRQKLTANHSTHHVNWHQAKQIISYVLFLQLLCLTAHGCKMHFAPQGDKWADYYLFIPIHRLSVFCMTSLPACSTWARLNVRPNTL